MPSDSEAVMPRAARTKRRTRIQAANEAKIQTAALRVFSAKGYGGTTLDSIAAAAGMSKSNLLYYFNGKEDVYRAVLNRTLDDWLEPLRALDHDGDPADEVRAYIRRKFEMARDRPLESRLFASEILRGAPMIHAVLSGPLRELVDSKVAVIRAWIDEGRLAPHDPYFLVFALWAMTQHYSDFDAQVHAVLGTDDGDASHFDAACRFVEDMVLNGLLPR